MGSRSQWLRGMWYVVAVALIWIAASFIVQDVEGNGVPPLLLTYICNSLFIFYLPVFFIGRTVAQFQESRGGAIDTWRRFCGSSFVTHGQHNEEAPINSKRTGPGKEGARGNSEKALLLETGSNETEGGVTRKSNSWSAAADESHLVPAGIGSTANGGEAAEMSSRESAKAGLWASPFWFAAQFTFNLSLSYTSVTSNTILSSTTSLFTFLISVKYLGERFTWPKLVSVSLCIVGTAVVSLADSSSSGANNTLFGDFLVIVSAIFYSTYTALIRWKLPDDEKNGSTMQFFGYLGLFNTVLFGPVVLIAHLTGPQQIHILPRQLEIVVAKGMFDNVLSDYIWARAVLLTSPTAATAGLSIQIPVAIVIDIFLKRRFPSPLLLFGGVMVLVGFLGINAPATRCCDESVQEDAEGQTFHSTSVMSPEEGAGSGIRHDPNGYVEQLMVAQDGASKAGGSYNL